MADQMTIYKLEDQAHQMRKNLIRLCYEGGALHIGGDLSMTDLMVSLHQYAMKYDCKNPKWEGRDRFILSKGHSAGSYYIAQAMAGYYDLEEIFSTYMHVDSRFGVHPCSIHHPSMEISTGSLGYGLGFSVGLALSARLKKATYRIYTVMGDGETNEGSVWESAMAAAHFELGNIVAFIDKNRLCLDGRTEDIMCMEPYEDKWRAFGWNVIEVDGHDMKQLTDAIDSLPAVDSNVPTVIVCNTIKGKGISFMENNPAWHAGSISKDVMEQCFEELDNAYNIKRRERQC